MSATAKGTHKKRKKARNRTEGTEHSFGNLFQSALFGALIGILGAMVLSFTAALICYRSADPDAMMTPLAMIALYLSALATGFAAVRRSRGYALLCGSMSGLLLLSFFLVLSLFLHNNAGNSIALPYAWLSRIAMIPCAILGGFFGLPKAKARRR